MTTKTKVQNQTVLKFIVPIIVEFDTVNYHSYSPALKGLHMDGETEKEALENARKTAQDILGIMIRKNIPIPLSVQTFEDEKTLPESKKKEGYYEEEITVTLK